MNGVQEVLLISKFCDRGAANIPHYPLEWSGDGILIVLYEFLLHPLPHHHSIWPVLVVIEHVRWYAHVRYLFH